MPSSTHSGKQNACAEVCAVFGEAFGGIQEDEYDVEKIEEVDIGDSLKRIESTI